MSDDGCGEDRINCFAVVAYIPDPLGRFLDDLRRSLNPGYEPHAHVTLMPPRAICCENSAWKQMQAFLGDQGTFDLELGGIQVFPCSDVVYVEINHGRATLLDLHRQLNCDALQFCEPFPFHPHVTIAQGLRPDEVAAVAARAREAWAAYRGPRSFEVHELTFVQNTSANLWVDIGTVKLQQAVPACVRR